MPLPDTQGPPRRETIYQALFDLGRAMVWGENQSFAFSKRRVLTFEQITEQPALCQAEWNENTVQVRSMDQKRTWDVAWFLYHFDGDPDVVTASTTNAMLDAVDALFTPTPWGEAQSLGGLVQRVWVEGSIEKYGGNVTGQTLIVVPIKILVP